MTNFGLTPSEALAKTLTTTLREGSLEEVDMLLAAGAPLVGPACGLYLPLFAFSGMNNTMLREHFGGMKRAVRMIERLLQCGAPVDQLDFSDRTALMYSAFRGHVPLIQLFLDYGANIDLRSPKTGCTALMEACILGQYEAVVTLIRAGADLRLTDLKERTVWDYAVASGYTDVMSLVKDALNGVMPKPVHRYSWRNLLPRWMG